MSSKNKTTIPARTQDTIPQQELMELAICQRELAEWTASCQHRRDSLTERLRGGAAVEPGRFSLNGTSVEVRA
jgi:hypothetical protein